MIHRKQTLVSLLEFHCSPAAAFAILIASLLFPSAAWPEMPSNWPDLPADEFATAAVSHFEGAEIARADGQPIVAHAWANFLSESAPTDSLSLKAIQQLIAITRPRLSWLTTEGDALARANETAQMKAHLSSLETDLRQRTLDNPEETASLEFRDLANVWFNAADPAVERSEAYINQRAEVFAVWLEQNDPKALPLFDVGLLARILSIDQLNKESFAVRWTGQLSPPASGTYRFGPLKHIHGNGDCRITIADQLVLDTASGNLEMDPGSSDLGEPIALTADAPVAIQVEYSYDQAQVLAKPVPNNNNQAVQYPMMVLTWETPSGDVTTVPPTVFSPPEDAPGDEEAGLLAEYFSSGEISVPVASRIEQGIGGVWHEAPVLPVYSDHYEHLVDVCLQKLSTTDAPESLSPPFRSPLFRLAQFTGTLNSIWDRQRVYERVISSPDDLKSLSAGDFSGTFLHLAMLPNHTRSNLLSDWCELHPHPDRITPSRPDAWTFQYLHHFGYQLLGSWISDRYVDDLDILLSGDLLTSEGAPNLNLICILATACRYEDRVSELRGRIRSIVDSEPLTGDERAAWLGAQAWAEEIFASDPPHPATALSIFEQAADAAQGTETAYHALRDLLIRQIYLGLGDAAASRLELAQSQFTDPDQQATLAVYQEVAGRAAQIAADMEEVGRARQKRESKQIQAVKLQERIAQAQARGDSNAVSKYQSQLSQIDQAE